MSQETNIANSMVIVSNDNFNDIVTREEAENLAKRVCSPEADLVDYHIRAYSEEQIGFFGCHLRLDVTARRPGSTEHENHSFFVKTIPRDNVRKAAYIVEKGIFRKEADFFRYVEPILTDNFKGESWAPKCYLAKDDTVVFEDMKPLGFASRTRSFDVVTAKAAIGCLARLHSSSLLAEKMNGNSFVSLHPHVFQETEFKRIARNMLWYTVAVDLLVSLAEEMGYESGNIRRASECVLEMAQASRTKRNVVSHGDLWSSNMLFDSEDRCRLVDFQMIRYVPLAHDVMQLLYQSTTRQFRREHEAQMIRYYYDTLIGSLGDNGLRGDDLPSFQELVDGVEEQRLPALVAACVFHPTVLMNGKTAGKIMSDPQNYEAYSFGSRKPFVDGIMAEDPEYERWLKDDVRELAEMSMRLETVPKLS